jgi:hypothetical protein
MRSLLFVESFDFMTIARPEGLGQLEKIHSGLEPATFRLVA